MKKKCVMSMLVVVLTAVVTGGCGKQEKPVETVMFDTSVCLQGSVEAVTQTEAVAEETATELGFLDKTWSFEDFSIGENNVHVTAFDYYYDLHDTKSTRFPIECLFDKKLLGY